MATTRSTRWFEKCACSRLADTGIGISQRYGHICSSPWWKACPGMARLLYLLPRVEGQADQEGLAPALATSGDNRGAFLLLMADEESLRSPLARALRKSGYSVFEALSGLQALDVAELHDGPIDLVVTDFLMRGVSGKELADRLRASLPGLKVLYMSAQAQKDIVHHGVLDKGVQLLTKPFTIQKIALESRRRSKVRKRRREVNPARTRAARMIATSPPGSSQVRGILARRRSERHLRYAGPQKKIAPFAG